MYICFESNPVEMNNYYLAPRIKDSDYSKAFGYPIYLRFCYRGEECWQATGVYVKERKFWLDEIKKVVDGPNFRLKNDAISKLLNEAEARLLKAIADGDGPSAKAFKGNKLESFEAYIREVSPERAGGLIKQLIGFHGSVPNISQITVRFLRQLEDYMWGSGLERNSVVGYMGGVLRKVLNQAVIEGYITKSPICKEGYHVPLAGTTTPVYLLGPQRIEWLNELLYGKEFTGETYKVLAYFMLGCYTGLRYSDQALFDVKKNIKGSDLVVQAKKNHKHIVQPIRPNSPLAQILEIIKKVGPYNDIPYFRVLDHLDTIRKHFKLEQEIGTHVAKHSFGHLCASLGIPKETAAKLMGNTVKVVEVYYHLTGEHVEEQSKGLAAA